MNTFTCSGHPPMAPGKGVAPELFEMLYLRRLFIMGGISEFFGKNYAWKNQL